MVPSYLAGVSYLTAFGWSFLGLLMVEAYPAIRILYGSQWMDAVPIAQVLGLACAIDLLSLLSREALLASGDARRANVLQMGIAGLHLAGLTAALPFGLMGACWGMVMAAILSVALTQWHLRRGIGLRAKALIARCIPSLALAVLSVGPIAVWSELTPADQYNYWWTGPLGAFLTVSLWLVSVRVWRRELWRDLVSWHSTQSWRTFFTRPIG